MAEGPPERRGTGEAQVHEIRIAGGQTRAPPRCRDPVRRGGLRRTLKAIGLGLAGFTAGLWMLAGLRAPLPRPALAPARAPGPSVSGADRAPGWCVSITIPAIHPGGGPTELVRRQLCGRYNGYMTAVRLPTSSRRVDRLTEKRLGWVIARSPARRPPGATIR